MNEWKVKMTGRFLAWELEAFSFCICFFEIHNYELLDIESESVSRSVVPNSLQPHGLQPTRLFCLWDFPGKDIGAGCHFLQTQISCTADRFFTDWTTRIRYKYKWAYCIDIIVISLKNIALLILFLKVIWQFLALSLGEGNGTSLQYSCLENPMDGGAW